MVPSMLLSVGFRSKSAPDPAELRLEIPDGNPAVGLLTPEEWGELGVILKLTPREIQVLILTFEGCTREVTAKRLRLKPRTVRQHLERIHLKLKVHDRVGLVLRVIRVRDAWREMCDVDAKDALRGDVG